METPIQITMSMDDKEAGLQIKRVDGKKLSIFDVVGCFASVLHQVSDQANEQLAQGLKNYTTFDGNGHLLTELPFGAAPENVTKLHIPSVGEARNVLHPRRR